MSQDATGGVQANNPGASFRALLNTSLAAIITQNSGASAPTVTYAYMFWADTTTGNLKQRDSLNANWIIIGPMGTAYLGMLQISGGNMTGAVNYARTTVASAATPDIWTGTGNNINYTGTVTATGFAAAPQVGASRILDCVAAASFTAGANMLIDGYVSGATMTVAAGDRVEVFARTTTQFVLRLAPSNGGVINPGTVVLRSYLAGCGLSTAGASTTMSIAAGQAADSTNVVMMNLAAAIAKTTSAWAVGNNQGGLDTGTIAASTWYHFYVIRRPDTGVVDVVFSTSASAPTLPTSYTQYRGIGSGKTNGSSQWTSFMQDGDFFAWIAPPTDSTTVPTTATLRTLSTPLGKIVTAKLSVSLGNAGGAGAGANHWDPALGSALPSAGSGLVSITEGLTGTLAIGADALEIRTNTSSQIYNAVSGTVTSYGLVTEGWFDTRGRNL